VTSGIQSCRDALEWVLNFGPEVEPFVFPPHLHPDNEVSEWPGSKMCLIDIIEKLEKNEYKSCKNFANDLASIGNTYLTGTVKGTHNPLRDCAYYIVAVAECVAHMSFEYVNIPFRQEKSMLNMSYDERLFISKDNMSAKKIYRPDYWAFMGKEEDRLWKLVPSVLPDTPYGEYVIGLIDEFKKWMQDMPINLRHGFFDNVSIENNTLKGWQAEFKMRCDKEFKKHDMKLTLSTWDKHMHEKKATNLFMRKMTENMFDPLDPDDPDEELQAIFAELENDESYYTVLDHYWQIFLQLTMQDKVAQNQKRGQEIAGKKYFLVKDNLKEYAAKAFEIGHDMDFFKFWSTKPVCTFMEAASLYKEILEEGDVEEFNRVEEEKENFVRINRIQQEEAVIAERAMKRSKMDLATSAQDLSDKKYLNSMYYEIVASKELWSSIEKYFKDTKDRDDILKLMTFIYKKADSSKQLDHDMLQPNWRQAACVYPSKRQKWEDEEDPWKLKNSEAEEYKEDCIADFMLLNTVRGKHENSLFQLAHGSELLTYKMNQVQIVAAGELWKNFVNWYAVACKYEMSEYEQQMHNTEKSIERILKQNEQQHFDLMVNRKWTEYAYKEASLVEKFSCCVKYYTNAKESELDRIVSYPPEYVTAKVREISLFV
jgi:hypothetical protein